MQAPYQENAFDKELAVAASRTHARDDQGPQPRHLAASRLALIVGAAAVLYVAQPVFLPLSIAMLVAFALSPLVTRLRHTGLALLWTVMVVVSATFLVVALLAFVMAGQLGQLVRDLPTFRGNILQKIEGLRQAGGESGLVSRLNEMAAAVGATVEGAMAGDTEGTPLMAVEVVERISAYDLVTSFLLPLVGPVGNAGLVVILVVFMLLEREQLRERFIRLVGSRDLNRTTKVLDEAGTRAHWRTF